MGAFELILILAIFKSAIGQGGDLLKPCKIKDMICLSATTQNFLEQTSAGIPNYNIKPIDPIVIPELDFEIPEFNLVFHCKNINVTGLKTQQISDFKLDKDTKSVVLQTRVDDANIASDVTIEMKTPSKFFSGTFSVKTTVIGTSKYNYELIPDKDGVEYFEVGPETITCEALETPVLSLDPELTNTIANDPDAQAVHAEYTAKAPQIRKDLIAEIFRQAYVTVIHNIRASAKIFPKTAFFIDI